MANSSLNTAHVCVINLRLQCKHFAQLTAYKPNNYLEFGGTIGSEPNKLNEQNLTAKFGNISASPDADLLGFYGFARFYLVSKLPKVMKFEPSQYTG